MTAATLLHHLQGHDLGTIFVCLGRQSEPFYPEDYETEIEAVIEAWRPEIWAESQK